MDVRVHHSMVGIGQRGAELGLAPPPPPGPGLGSVRLHGVPRQDSSIRGSSCLLRLPLGVGSRDPCGSGPDSAPMPRVTWPPHPSEPQLGSLVGPPSGALAGGTFFGERAGAVASVYEDIWTLLLLGNPRRNVVWNLEGPTDRVRSLGLAAPCTRVHARTHSPPAARLSIEQKMPALSRTLLPLHKNSLLSALTRVPLCPHPHPTSPTKNAGALGAMVDADNEG